MAFLSAPHAGSWSIGGYKLPDFGVTEGLSKLLGGNTGYYQTSQGGSNLFGSNTTGQSFVPSNTPINPYISSANVGSVLGDSTSNPAQASNTNTGSNTNQTRQSVQAPSVNTGSVFDEVFNLLNGQESALNNQKQDYINKYAGIYDTYLPQIEQSRQNAQAVNQQQQAQVKTDKQNNINSARRTTNELAQGVQQKFGGSSSAGEFANNFLGREFQRQAGQIGQAADNNLQSLYAKAQDNELQYQKQVNDINVQKAQLLSSIEQQFQQRLSDINNTRFQTQQAKAQAKMDELNRLRSAAQSVSNQFTQIEQQIAAQNESARQAIASQLAAYQATSGLPVDLKQLPEYLRPNFVPGSTSDYTAQSLQGQIKKRALQN